MRAAVRGVVTANVLRHRGHFFLFHRQCSQSASRSFGLVRQHEHLLQPLSKASPRQLLATRDGGLWVVFDTGRVSRLLDGEVTMFPLKELPRTNSLAEDPDGSIMAAGTGLLRFRNGRWQEAAKALHQTAKLWAAVWFDQNGALWLITEARLLKLPHGGDHFVDVGVSATVRRAKPSRFAQSPDGAVWMVDEEAIHVVNPEKSPIQMKLVASAIIADRDGSMWLGNPHHGLWRIPARAGARLDNVVLSDQDRSKQGFEEFTRADGLSGDEVLCALEDREGNIWIGTDQGLDRFRESAFHRVALPDPGRTDALAELKNGGLVMMVRDQPWLRTVEPDGKTARLEIGLPATSVCSAEDNTLWFVTSKGFGRLSGKGVSYPPQPQLNAIRAISCDGNSVWVSDALLGVFRYTGGKTEKIPGLRPQVLTFFQETPDKVWIPYSDGTISIYEKGSIRQYGEKDGLTGNIYDILQTANGDLWMAAENALLRFRNGHFQSVDVTPGAPIWSLARGDGSFIWFRAAKNMVRMDTREFDRALTNRGYKPQVEVYGTREGLPDAAALARRSLDRIWVVTTNGFGYLDATPRLRKNALPPPVQIEIVTADGKSFETAPGLRLPKLTHDLQIDYTALSLTYPEKVLFRYKLEGLDKDWQDVGTRRRAFFTDLALKRYSFRVIAANNDGVWNNDGAALSFSIDPAWYQTRWFESAASLPFWPCSGVSTVTGCNRWRNSSTCVWRSVSLNALVSPGNCMTHCCKASRHCCCASRRSTSCFREAGQRTSSIRLWNARKGRSPKPEPRCMIYGRPPPQPTIWLKR